MDNNIYLPHVNPIKFVVQNLPQDARFQQLPMDAALFQDSILPFQHQTYYCQKVQKTDTLYFQIVSNYGPITCKVVDCNGTLIATPIASLVQNGFYQAPNFCYGVTIDFATIDPGKYYVLLSIGTGAAALQLISEPLQVAESFPNTLLIQYTNSNNAFGCIFENGEMFSIRVEGIFKEFTPGANEVVYEDEPANLVHISSTPFRTFKITFGNAQGIPDWLADRINRLFGCDTVTINGMRYTRTEGGKLERNGNAFNATAGWTVEVREALAAQGVTIVNNNLQNNSIVVAYDIDGTFFGVTNNNNSIIILKKD